MLRLLILCFLIQVTAASSALAQTARAPWWDRAQLIEAGHYAIRTDLPRDHARRLAIHLNNVHDTFTRCLTGIEPRSPERLNVLIFKELDDYELTLGIRYGLNARHTGGMFFTTQEFTGLAFWTGTLSQRRIEHVLQHEAFHQFAWSRFGNDLPNWVNEGLAEVFGQAVFIDDQMYLGLPAPNLVDRIQSAIESDAFIPFDRFLDMGPEEWANAVSRQEGPVLYPQAWAMVQFLLYGGNQDSALRQKFMRYLQQLNVGVRHELAFNRAFGANGNPPDREQFEASWLQFTRDLHPNPFLTALERIEFIAEGILYLRDLESTTPRSLYDLWQALETAGFKHSLRAHGRLEQLVASDSRNFRIPKLPIEDARTPVFVVQEPKPRPMSLAERKLESVNPTPPDLFTQHLEPFNLRVAWIRDPETNTFSFDIRSAPAEKK